MKQAKHHQLTQYDRDRIEALLNAGHKQKEIADILKVDKSTISREINRNKRKRKGLRGILIDNGKYDADLANHKAYVRRKYAKWQGQIVESNDELKKYIIQGLKNHLNPDEISGRMRLDKQSFYASKNSIYRWLYSMYGQRYCKYLSTQRVRKKKRKKKTKRVMIPNRTGIEHRLKNIDNEYNHYESDTIVSKKSKKSLAVLYERKTKYVRIKKIKNLKPNSFNKALIEMKNGIKKTKSLTLDNGIENRYWEELNIDKVYFCDPYSSWQKGGVENINRMIRRYIPKGSDISKYSHQYIQNIVNILNNKPRKSLNYKTPYEVMIENDLLNENMLNQTKNTTSKVAFRG
jgi:IS30 family transposase